MIETLRKIDYPLELIDILLKSKLGALVANVIAPIFIFFMLKEFVPLPLLYTLTLLQFSTYIMRLIISRSIEKELNTADKKTIQRRLKYYLFMIFITATLLGISGSFAIIYATELEVYMLIGLVFALISGSLSTLSPVYHAVFIYVVTTLSIFIFMLILVRSTTYYMIAILIFMYILVSLSGSFRIYNETYKNIEQNKEIIALNKSLEGTIKLRTKELVEKTMELESLNKSLDQRVKEESEKLRKNEQLLIQQSRQAAMGEMIGNIAHQWRQPLNALGLILQNIHLSYHLDDLNDTFMDKSTDKGNKLIQSMSKTIDDFRDFFKPNKEKEHFNIATVINQSVELVAPAYSNSFIEIETQLDSKLEFYSYPREFSQVILNILSNAKDALNENTVEEKKVSIKSFKKNQTIMIEIGDNAGGIPKSVIDKIFEPYFTTKEEGKGTGIGLYMSKTIIEENMSGTLSVQNEKDGALFTITFPQATQESKIADVPYRIL